MYAITEVTGVKRVTRPTRGSSEVIWCTLLGLEHVVRAVQKELNEIDAVFGGYKDENVVFDVRPR